MIAGSSIAHRKEYEMKEVVRIIRQECKRQGITIAELSNKAGFSRNMLSNWEKGIEPSIGKVDAALKVLGITYAFGAKGKTKGRG